MVHSQSTALLTLANKTAILTAGPTMTRGGQLLSMRAAIALSGLTAGDGPFMIGIMSKQLDLTQLEAYLEIGGPVSPDETANAELASRGAHVRNYGMLIPSGNGTVGGLYLDNRSMSGLRWTEETAGWNHWLYNMGPALTTGATVVYTYAAFVRWNKSG